MEIVSPQILTDYVYTGLPVTDKLMILIWCLANREAYRVLSRRFGMNQGTVHYVVMKTMKVIYNMADLFIVWPREERYLELSENFQIVDSLGSFFNDRNHFCLSLNSIFCLGAIDATEFEIRQPLNQLPSYTSRKCKTTIKLQIVSTHDLEIIDAAVGFPGSIGDARVLRLSPFSRALGAKLVRSNYHILGDTAYPLRQHLLVPFRNNHELEDHEMAFNRALKRDRQVVERAFGLLKMKWRRVKFLDYFRMRYAHRTLLVCCCFHNFGLRHDNWLDDAPDVELDDEEDPDYEFDEERETEEGLQKRQFIAEQFIV